jgi:hypothetical protein
MHPDKKDQEAVTKARILCAHKAIIIAYEYHVFP